MESRGAALEPGLLLSFRIYVLVTALGPGYSFNLWRVADPSLPGPASFGVQLPIIILNLVVTVFLLVYTLRPWFRHRLGRAFLPIALIVQAAHPIARYFTFMPEVPAALMEQYSVLNLARISAHATLIVIFIAGNMSCIGRYPWERD